MAAYRVTWEIDADGDTPRDAAEWALAIQRRAGSSAVVFNVTDEKGEITRVDLDGEEADDAEI